MLCVPTQSTHLSFVQLGLVMAGQHSASNWIHEFTFPASRITCADRSEQVLSGLHLITDCSLIY